MFDIKRNEYGHILISGRFDASRVKEAQGVLDEINGPCTLDFTSLEYISSAGLGSLLATQKRLTDKGQGLKLINLNKHIRDIFRVAGFDFIFDIE
jgi:anti-sigma B factor antagonist